MILHKLRGKRKAFTLIELLVVVAIIELLATLVVLAVINAKKKADTARAKDSVKKVYDAISIVIADDPAGTYSTVFRVVNPTAAGGINSGKIATQDGNNLIPEIPYDYKGNSVQYKLTTDSTSGNVQIVVKGVADSASTRCWVVSNAVTANGVVAPASNLNKTTLSASDTCPS